MPLRPFNILYLSSFGSTGRGGQESLFHLVTNLDRKTFHPHVNLPAEGDLAKRLGGKGIEVTILGFPRVFQFRADTTVRALYSLLKLVNEHAIHLIHTDGPRNTFYAGLVAKIKSVPLIWHVRASNPDTYDRLLYHLSTKLILVANSLRSRFDWVEENHKFVTIYNGIDLSEFRTTTSLGRIRAEYRISDNALLITLIARVERLKGQEYLIEACGRLKGILKDFRVLLVGEIVDAPYLKECREKADQLGIEDRVTFTGYQNRISHILNETDIFVLPSLFEAFPRSLIEAMGVGKPVVVTNVGGCLEAVEDGVSGFIVPAGDPQAIADRIYRLAVDSKLRLRLGKAARMRAEERFSIQWNVKQTQELYQEILGENTHAIRRSHL
jgi:glycosyltransferase involved in cell wall biosynthesis